MKKFSLIVLLISISNVFSQDISNKYAETITSEELKSLLYVYASDSFEGREAGTKGEILAVEFIRDFYVKNASDRLKKMFDEQAVVDAYLKVFKGDFSD